MVQSEDGTWFQNETSCGEHIRKRWECIVDELDREKLGEKCLQKDEEYKCARSCLELQAYPLQLLENWHKC